MAGGPSTTYGWHPAAQDQRLREIWNKAPVGTALTAETSDAQGLNQLAARGSGTALPIRGTTNEPVSAVTVNGLAAKITGGNRFEGTANVTAGNNTVTVAATDYGQPPNTATKQYQVAVAAGVSDSLSYDDSGNTLARAGRTYEWDSLDRMTAVTVGAQRTEFLYDGLGRRRKITEKANGTVTSVKRLAYDGADVAEERVNGTNVLTKRFFGTGMQVLSGADAGRYIYTRDHLGSIREAWKVESASVAVRYDYEPYGRRTKLGGGTFDADFGFTGHYTHAPTGLVLAHYRPYEPSIARWLSRDPIGEDGGINLYGYVLNDPTDLWDSSGLAWYDLDHVSNFSAGAADVLTFGLADKARRGYAGMLDFDENDQDSMVNKCSDSYKDGRIAGTVLSAVQGAGRLAYAGAAKASSMALLRQGGTASNAVKAITYRNSLKTAFNLGFENKDRVMTMGKAVGKYGGDFSEIIKASGRTSPAWNAAGVYFSGAAVTGAVQKPCKK